MRNEEGEAVLMVRKFGLLLAIIFVFILTSCGGSEKDKNGESPSQFVLKYAQADANNDMEQLRKMVTKSELEASEDLKRDYKKLDEQLAKYRLYESEKDGVFFYKLEYETDKGDSRTEYYKVVKEDGFWKIGDYYYKEKDYLFDTKGLETKSIEGAKKQ